MRSLFAVFLVVCCGYALAQSYPQRSVRMVVPVAAGGSTDVMGRQSAVKLGERLGQQFVVDNRPGGSRMIGAEIVAKAQPDGHTLLMAAGSFGTLSGMFAKLPFDMEKDFAPMCLLATSPYVLVLQPALPIKSVPDWVPSRINISI